ncbi:MAG TPA: M28 family peptidase, partial [Gemmatimonadales bacterium]|nr:M28 family peptidase [Gemmatimonadales bacterium]
MMKRLVLAGLAGLVPGLLTAQGPKQPAAEYVPAPATTLPLKHAPRPTEAAITPGDLMTRLYIFADDSMMGRRAGTEGNTRGTDYIAREVKRLGLTPAGEDGTFFQTLPFKTRSVDSSSSLSVGGAALAYGTEWAGRADASAKLADLPVLFGGPVDDPGVSADQMRGKLVVFTMQGNGGFRAVRALMRQGSSAAAVGVVVPPPFLGFFHRPSTFVDAPDAGTPHPDTPILFLTAEAAGKLFAGSPDGLAPGATGATASLDLIVHLEPVPYPARNVVAILPGSDPKLRSEYVAIGAHNDHIGMTQRPVDHDSLRLYNHLVRPGGAEDSRAQATPEQQQEINRQLAAWRAAHPGTEREDSISNGADDDGSGSVSVLEMAEHLASLKTAPRRSILFVWHVGEELGMLGSGYFTDHPTVPRDSIVAQLNIDMIGRGDAADIEGGGPNYLQLIGSRRLSTELGDLVESVNTSGKHGFAFDYQYDADGHPQQYYCRSDHYEYARFGIPIVFFSTGSHPDYHMLTDEPQYIDYDHMARVAGLIEDIALHVADLDHRVVVDHPKPDPNGICR